MGGAVLEWMGSKGESGGRGVILFPSQLLNCPMIIFTHCIQFRGSIHTSPEQPPSGVPKPRAALGSKSRAVLGNICEHRCLVRDFCKGSFFGGLSGQVSTVPL